MISRRVSMAIALSMSISAPALTAAPYPTRSMAAPEDLGAITAQTGGATLTVTLPLKLRDEAGAEALLKTVSEPGSAGFHQFLTPAQFKAQFAQSDADASATVAYLATFGLTAERVGATSLQVTGTASAMERAFQVSLHRYQVAAQADAPSFTFQAPTSAPKIPTEISTVVAGVVGLSTRPSFVGPQLNGVMGLIGQYVGGRIGLLNVPMYELASRSGAYTTGKSAPFNVIQYGNNDFYVGRDGYSPAAGIGALNVSDFADALKKIY